MFRQRLYRNDGVVEVDDSNRLRLDDWELREDIQAHCIALWPQLTNENLAELTDYRRYKEEFLKLFGFGVAGVDDDAAVDTLVPFEVITV